MKKSQLLKEILNDGNSLLSNRKIKVFFESIYKKISSANPDLVSEENGETILQDNLANAIKDDVVRVISSPNPQKKFETLMSSQVKPSVQSVGYAGRQIPKYPTLGQLDGEPESW